MATKKIDLMKRIAECKSGFEARDIALDWQDWQASQSMSWSECATWQVLFYDLAKRYDLIKEFKEWTYRMFQNYDKVPVGQSISNAELAK